MKKRSLIKMIMLSMIVMILATPMLANAETLEEMKSNGITGTGSVVSRFNSTVDRNLVFLGKDTASYDGSSSTTALVLTNHTMNYSKHIDIIEVIGIGSATIGGTGGASVSIGDNRKEFTYDGGDPELYLSIFYRSKTEVYYQYSARISVLWNVYQGARGEMKYDNDTYLISLAEDEHDVDGYDILD